MCALDHPCDWIAESPIALYQERPYATIRKVVECNADDNLLMENCLQFILNLESSTFPLPLALCLQETTLLITQNRRCSCSAVQLLTCGSASLSVDYVLDREEANHCVDMCLFVATHSLHNASAARLMTGVLEFVSAYGDYSAMVHEKVNLQELSRERLVVEDAMASCSILGMLGRQAHGA